MSNNNKSSDAFKRTIKKELDLRAFKNPLFAKHYENKDKNLDDCISYIFQEVKSSGQNGFADDEIYGMAVHYYSEKDVKVGSFNGGQVVVNHEVKLTAEEIEEARREAKERVIKEEMAKMRKKPQKKKG